MLLIRQLSKVPCHNPFNLFRARSYASSRFPNRVSGAGRVRPTLRSSAKQGKRIDGENVLLKDEGAPFIFNGDNTHQIFQTDMGGLEKLLLQNDTLVIERQLEMLNVFIGVEESNKYTISNDNGEPLGYIAEEPKGFLGTLSRQLFATHRPFRAVIMDQQGLPILWESHDFRAQQIRRPFAWINSRMFVQRSKVEHVANAQPSLETFGEVQQIWHPWRRRYDLFLREIFTDPLVVPPNSQTGSDDHSYYQIGKVDSGFLSWQFHILNGNGDIIWTVDRAFRGFGREIFTDTGRYSIQFKPSALSYETQLPGVSVHKLKSQSISTSYELDIDTRALLLALAVNIDFDYFSRHSHTGSGGLFHLTSWH